MVEGKRMFCSWERMLKVKCRRSDWGAKVTRGSAGLARNESQEQSRVENPRKERVNQDCYCKLLT